MTSPYKGVYNKSKQSPLNLNRLKTPNLNESNTTSEKNQNTDLKSSLKQSSKNKKKDLNVTDSKTKQAGANNDPEGQNPAEKTIENLGKIYGEVVIKRKT